MKLYQFEDAVEFHDRTQSYLLQHEAQQFFLLNFIKALVKSPEQHPKFPYLAIVEEDGEVIGQGCKFCYLSTNIKTSTFKHIYTTVGYQAVCDWHRYKFEPS
ncbi:hypothetical protein [Phormidesmis sp. 146-33]